MKNLFLLALIVGSALLASASVTVTVSTPANSATVPANVQVAATASTTVSSITGWRIYADNVSVYNGGAAPSISPTIALSPGTHNLIIRAWAGDGSYGSQSRTVTVGGSNQVSVSLSAPANNATVNSSVAVAATASTSGSSITGWRVYVDGNSAYAGPATASINTNIAMAPGTHTIIVRAWNGYGNYGSQTSTVSVGSANANPTPLKIVTSTLPAATAGSSYSTTLTASGGIAPYRWSVVSGALPAGLSLSSSGVISGTPTTPGTGYFSVSAKDSASSPQAATQSESISVAAAGGVNPPPQAAGYNLKFSDDFNTLNLSPNGNGSGYNWYNPGMFWHSPAPYSHITAANGILHLNWTPGQAGGADTSIATASQNGANARTWRYGYFEVRMRWNPVTGAWPAIWLIPTAGYSGAKDQGELDIFEGQGASPHTFWGTIHHWLNGGNAGSNPNSQYNLGSNVDFTQFHTYGCLWEPGRVTWYFDNQPLMSAPTYSIFDQQDYYLILGSQEGANWNYGNMSGVTASSIRMDVDWVRVWQR